MRCESEGPGREGCKYVVGRESRCARVFMLLQRLLLLHPCILTTRHSSFPRGFRSRLVCVFIRLVCVFTRLVCVFTRLRIQLLLHPCVLLIYHPPIPHGFSILVFSSLCIFWPLLFGSACMHFGHHWRVPSILVL